MSKLIFATLAFWVVYRVLRTLQDNKVGEPVDEPVELVEPLVSRL